MKKITFIVLLALIVLLVSCKDKIIVKIDPDLVGSWTNGNTTYTLREDGRFKQVWTNSYETETSYGTWTTSDGILLLETDVNSLNFLSTVSADNPMYCSLTSSNGGYYFKLKNDLDDSSSWETYRDDLLYYDGKKYVYEEKNDSEHDFYSIEISNSSIILTEEYKGSSGGDKQQVRLNSSKVIGYSNVYKITEVKYTYYIEVCNYSVDGNTLTIGIGKYTKN